MSFNFDEHIERKGTNSYKWDSSNDPEILPMWVADMDFKTAPPIIEALTKRVQHGVFGYARVPDSFYDAIISWFDRRHHFMIEKEWVLYTSGVVPAISAVILALTRPGDKILVQEPVYNCFFSSVRNNQCEVVSNDLIYSGGKYSVDFDDLEEKTADPDLKMMLLCNPHNPVGRVWTKDELMRIGEICFRNDVIVVSDEIHCDLVYEGHRHIPFASLGQEYREKSVTCVAPGKTFNLAGLQVAGIIASEPQHRKMIDKALNINEVCDISPFAVEGLIAAYSDPVSEQWLDELIKYLWANYLFLKEFFEQHLPQFPVITPEATYLVWIDFSSLNIPSSELAQIFIEDGHIWLNEGTLYGEAGEGFMRFNIACQRNILEEGLSRLKKAIDRINK